MTVLYKKNKNKEKKVGVSIITITNRPSYRDKIFNNFLRQAHQKKELIIVLHNNSMDLKAWKKRGAEHPNIKVFQCDETNHYRICCNLAFDNTKFEYIAIFDDDDFYGEKHLTRSLNTFNTKSCDIVGKKSFFIYFENNRLLALCFPNHENKYVTQVADSSMVIRREIVERFRFPCPPDEGVLTTFQRNCYKSGVKIYSDNRFNYVVHRHPNPANEHSWKIEADELLKHCKVLKKDVDYYKEYIQH